MLTLLLLACAPTTTTPLPDAGPGDPGRVVLRGATIPGLGRADLAIEAGRITAVGEVPEGGEDVDLSGRFLVPAFIDSHVHVAFWEVGAELPPAGVVAAVDLAAPEAWIGQSPGGLTVLWAGPMVTAVDGYPVSSWGAGGYGVECSTPEEAAAAVRRLHGLGADLIKLPITSSSLPREALAAAVAEAHGLGLLVTAHALEAERAALAAELGVDVLAHTPTQSLGTDELAAWSRGAVVSTLRAFGGGPDTVDNLRRLHEAGATVLYGTDLGNTRTAAIDAEELRLLEAAGLDGAAILEAATAAPARLWGLEQLGALEVGRDASLLVLEADPHTDPGTLARPVQVWVRGEAR